MDNLALRAWMAEYRYTGATLARLLDVHPSTVQRWRDGNLVVPRMAALALETLARPKG